MGNYYSYMRISTDTERQNFARQEKALKKYAEEQGIPAYISLEEHMACGVGACLGCVVKTKKVDSHSHVNNARICTDGPVFEAGEVDI